MVTAMLQNIHSQSMDSAVLFLHPSSPYISIIELCWFWMNSLQEDHASRGNLLVCCSAAWEEVAGAKEGRGAEGRETGRVE